MYVKQATGWIYLPRSETCDCRLLLKRSRHPPRRTNPVSPYSTQWNWASVRRKSGGARK